MLKILIVEDEVITANDIKETLEKAGHQVTAMARNFKEAVAAVKRQLPDLALVDIQLSKSSEDGISTAKELLSYHFMPIIYLTANSEKETLQRAKETLPAAYLLKPFRQQELVVQVELAYANRKTTPTVAESDTLYLPINKGYEKLNKSQVLYLDADGAYVKAYLVNEEQPRLFSMNLGHLLPYFSPNRFYKLSRSVLVNLDYVERLEGNQLWMRDQAQSLSIPTANRAELMRKLTVVRTP